MNPFRDTVAPTTRQLLLRTGHLAALWALAFAQPLFDLLGGTPDFFVARGNSPGDILILGFVFILLPAIGFLVVEWVTSKIGPRTWLATHLFLFSVLAAFLFIQLLDPLMPNLWFVVVLIALVFGALLGIASVQVAFVRNLFDILIVAPVVVLVVFLLFSRSTDLIFPEEPVTTLGASVGREVPVVIVSFDEIGTVNLMGADGQIDTERFPNFGRMAETSTWYPNHTTTSYFTPTAMPGILSGNRPPDGSLPTAADQSENIFTLLGDSYELHSFEWITDICPEELCPIPKSQQVAQRVRLKSLFSDLRYVVGRLVLPSQLADELPDVGANFEDFDGGGSEVAETKKDLIALLEGGRNNAGEYTRFIREIPTTDRALTMMHIKLPHKPWRFGVRGERYDPEPLGDLSLGTTEWLVDEPGIASIQQRMLVQTGYADTVLGEILDQLEKTGLWDRAMVVVTADHGLSFQGDGIPPRIAGAETMGENANPPLLIKYPGESSGKIDRRQVTTLDIVPTIARELRVKGMYETDGFPIQGEVPERDIVIKNLSLDEFRADIDTVIAQRNVALKRQIERLGDGPLYSLGPSPELIGTRPEATGPTAGVGVELERAEDWEDYRPGEPWVPMYVTGSLTGVSPNEEVAVAVNGRIRGTARAFDFEDGVWFGTVIDPAALKTGYNRIDLYLVEGRRLSLIGSNGPSRAAAG